MWIRDNEQLCNVHDDDKPTPVVRNAPVYGLRPYRLSDIALVAQKEERRVMNGADDARDKLIPKREMLR